MAWVTTAVMAGLWGSAGHGYSSPRGRVCRYSRWASRPVCVRGMTARDHGERKVVVMSGQERGEAVSGDAAARRDYEEMVRAVSGSLDVEAGLAAALEHLPGRETR